MGSRKRKSSGKEEVEMPLNLEEFSHPEAPPCQDPSNEDELTNALLQGSSKGTQKIERVYCFGKPASGSIWLKQDDEPSGRKPGDEIICQELNDALVLNYDEEKKMTELGLIWWNNLERYVFPVQGNLRGSLGMRNWIRTSIGFFVPHKGWDLNDVYFDQNHVNRTCGQCPQNEHQGPARDKDAEGL